MENTQTFPELLADSRRGWRTLPYAVLAHATALLKDEEEALLVRFINDETEEDENDEVWSIVDDVAEKCGWYLDEEGNIWSHYYEEDEEEEAAPF